MSHRASRRCAGPIIDPHHEPTSAAYPGGRDRGFSLVEIVIAIALMAIVVIAILHAVSTTVAASATSRSAAQVETALVNAADRVNRAPKRCDYSIYAQAAVQTQGWPAAAATLTHQYYIPGADAVSTGSWAVGPPQSPGCPGATPADLLVQRVTISITSPDGKVRRTIQVVKSDV